MGVAISNGSRGARAEVKVQASISGPASAVLPNVTLQGGLDVSGGAGAGKDKELFLFCSG